MRTVTIELTTDEVTEVTYALDKCKWGGTSLTPQLLETFRSALAGEEKVTKLEEKRGSLASGYRSSLVSLDILMRALNEMQEDGKLPPSRELDQAIGGIMVALKLGSLHFPSLHFKAAREVPESPCPMCGVQVGNGGGK